MHDAPTTSPSRPPDDAEVVAFLRGRSAPCPRCSYDLRDITTPRCPECAEPLVLKVGSPQARFGWLVLAMAPGCFSGVAALFVAVPVGLTLIRFFPPGQGAPWPIIVADAFGFLSAASVVIMYRHRHRFMAWKPARQRTVAVSIWGAHVLMFALVLLALGYWY